MLNGLRAIQMFFAVLNRLFMSVNGSVAFVALYFLREIYLFSAASCHLDKDRIHMYIYMTAKNPNRSNGKHLVRVTLG